MGRGMAPPLFPMKSFSLRLALILSTLALGACASRYSFNELRASYYKVAVGMTEQQVVDLIGQPHRLGSDGSAHWVESEGDGNSLRLYVWFDAAGKVSRKSISESVGSGTSDLRALEEFGPPNGRIVTRER